MTTSAKLNIASSITSCLTVLAALPYEKELLSIFPPAWSPKIAVAGAIATVLLRIWKNSITPSAQ